MLTFFLLLLMIFFFFMIFQQLQFPACVRSASLRRQTKGVHPLSLYLVILGLLCLISEIWNQKVPLRPHFLDQNNEILKLVVGVWGRGREKPASLKQLWPVYNKAVILVSALRSLPWERLFFPQSYFSLSWFLPASETLIWNLLNSDLQHMVITLNLWGTQ